MYNARWNLSVRPVVRLKGRFTSDQMSIFVSLLRQKKTAYAVRGRSTVSVVVVDMGRGREVAVIFFLKILLFRRRPTGAILTKTRAWVARPQPELACSH